CYQDEGGNWLDSEELFELDALPGFAVARRGQHKATLAANINSERVLELVAPDGKRFASRVTGLSFFDCGSGQNVLIAQVQDSIGVHHPPNQIIYPNALTGHGVRADVRYTWRKGGLEQDIIVREMTTPEAYGLNPARTRLQCWTLFLEAPQPEMESRILSGEQDPAVRQVMAEPDFTDQKLNFGAFQILQGRAFSLDAQQDLSIPVGKEFGTTEQGQKFLIETVEYPAAKPSLEALAANQARVNRQNNNADLAHLKLSRGQLIAQLVGAPLRRRPLQTEKIQIAKADSAKRPGYVIDWDLVSSVNSNLWKADTTYYVSGAVSVKTNIFEGGCVIKFAPTNSAKLTITGPATFLSTNYAPVILTARDDHSVGEAIGANALSGVYANTALYFDNLASGVIYDVHDLRISHADIAMYFNRGRGHKVRNVQIIKCNTAIDSYDSWVQVLNGLVSRVGTGLHAAFTSGTTGTFQNVTFSECNNLGAFYALGRVTNSLLIAVTNIGSGFSYTGAYNGTNSDPAAVFQTVGAGAHYLATSSSFRDAGTTNIDSPLLASLSQLTTYPPIIAGELTVIDVDQTFGLQASRDIDAPDLGFHYTSLDWAFGGVYVTNATITLNPGTAIALYSPTNGGSSYYGIALGDNAKFISEGWPTNLNRIVRYNTVQEQSTTSWNTTPAEHIASAWNNPPNNPQARFRFTEWSLPAKDTYHFRGFVGSTAVPAFIDCQFHGGQFYSGQPTLNVTNCLFERVIAFLEDTNANAMNPTFRNCLLYGGALQLSNYVSGTWTLKDNLFDRVGVTQKGTITHDYNGYITNATAQWLTNSGTHNRFTNTFTWLSGALGRYYQATNSLFVNVGSTNANYVGMYHYTVFTNSLLSAKETNSFVDLGFHYVATTNGVPFDVDGDGLPDYLEDLNGNGTFDAGETDWTSYNSLNGLSGTPGLQVFTPLK
ncbi:MAG TPA: hypothetical protein VK615_17310, partial [Candidatus Binatia bacterium]|nr:hypothetical protein [Candidatus Binatia bacterium]